MAASPSAPVVSSITFDEPAYNAGDKITVTVVYKPGTSASSQSFTGTAKDSATAKLGSMVVTFTVINSDTTTLAVSDTGNRTWTPISNSGGTAVFTAIA